MTFTLNEMDEFDEELDEEEHELLPDEVPDDASDFVDEEGDEENAGDDIPDESDESEDDPQEDEELEETPPPPVVQTFIEVEPFRSHEVDNAAYAAAVTAYYEEKNYEQAIQKFGDALENASQQMEGSRSYSNDIIAKSLYWQAEAYVKMQDISQAIVIFENLIQTCRGHYLTVAAQRRAEQLKSSKAASH